MNEEKEKCCEEIHPGEKHFQHAHLSSCPENWEKSNTERLKFLEGKPTYNCIPRWNQHEVGCPCRDWAVGDLQHALDCAKRSNELLMIDRETDRKTLLAEQKKELVERLENLKGMYPNDFYNFYGKGINDSIEEVKKK